MRVRRSQRMSRGFSPTRIGSPAVRPAPLVLHGPMRKPRQDRRVPRTSPQRALTIPAVDRLERPGLPREIGHEIAGVVDEAGAGVTTLAPGDHVVDREA
jgi:hypothetical protein